ncbi:DUF3040 domain-containing protein [Leekyejoonella antrihumi]|uniref:DUF3040 domain-containing protein n=1 Tax=Leekyejoonella antrihumi TaxID=1660198 RepID=A0A563E348_9MICO|nr:DUF3040 domain-containing protein [Leekyejoonella antrihumi]TWP36957.1 DUF3040 domain-containing protein [Leekyejoonella antrihumi]
MPLSEHEQRLLEQMEQALYAEDPKFASHMVADPARSRARRRIVVGALGVVVGLGLVLVGAMSQQVWLAVVGFVAMVSGCAYALMPARHHLGTVEDDGSVRPARTPTQRPHHGGGPSRSRSSGGFMERLEERWDRRRHGG